MLLIIHTFPNIQLHTLSEMTLQMSEHPETTWPHFSKKLEPTPVTTVTFFSINYWEETIIFARLLPKKFSGDPYPPLVTWFLDDLSWYSSTNEICPEYLLINSFSSNIPAWNCNKRILLILWVMSLLRLVDVEHGYANMIFYLYNSVNHPFNAHTLFLHSFKIITASTFFKSLKRKIQINCNIMISRHTCSFDFYWAEQYTVCALNVNFM